MDTTQNTRVPGRDAPLQPRPSVTVRQRAASAGGAGALSIILAGLTLLASPAAPAQQPAAAGNQAASQTQSQEQLQEVVVTGTSIRGVAAPVGASLVTVDPQEIAQTGAQTMQQILSNVPAVTGFGSPAQGGFGSFDPSGTFAPTIHGLGASASNGTLVLVDGHRLPLSGVNHTLADPNIIAPLMVQQVQVLPQGASSTYGSDAVAGVINIITVKQFKGFEATGQYGFADGYNSQNYGALWGDNWENTSILASLNYERRSALSNRDRSFTRRDKSYTGGGNFASFDCSPAAVQPGGKGGFYLYPYTNGITSRAPCDTSDVADLLPEEARVSAMVKISHDINDRVSVNGDLVYSNEMTWSQLQAGTISAHAYGPGSTPPGGPGQINPYFQGPPGVTDEVVDFDANNLLKTHAQTAGGAKTIMGNGEADVHLFGDWLATLGITFGENQSTTLTTGTLCTSCALLAINGTTNAAGNPLTPSIPGTTTTVTDLPLTPNNALNVWSPTGAGTSAAVLRDLTDGMSWQTTNQSIKDFNLKFDGTLVMLPGGPLKGAIGGEYIDWTIYEQVVRPNNTGPATTGSQAQGFGWGRDVKSGYAELLVPIVGPGNLVPLVHSLDLDVSGRIDDYSDVGSTKNPRFALNWQPVQSLTVRGDYSRSFTAPALTSLGDNGITAESGYTSSGVVNNLSIPNTFPNAIGLPGCTASTPTCTIGTPTVTGLQVNGPNSQIKPEIGISWSTGLDWAPRQVPGLRLSATYWDISYTGLITSPLATFAISSPALSPLLTLYPGGATPAQIAAAVGSRPQTGAVAPTIYWIYSYQQRNALNLQADGIDGDIAYQRPTHIGTLSADLSESIKLKMMQQFGTGGEWFSVLNTSGFNTTFPSNEIAARLNLGWSRGPATVHLIGNFEGSYYNWNGSAPYPVKRDATFSPIAGGQHVSAVTIVNLYAAYNFTQGYLANTQVSLTANDLLNTAPPFFNSAAGFDPFNGNPIQRVITLGITKKW